MGKRDEKKIMSAVDRLLKRAARLETLMAKDMLKMGELIDEINDLRVAYETVWGK